MSLFYLLFLYCFSSSNSFQLLKYNLLLLSMIKKNFLYPLLFCVLLMKTKKKKRPSKHKLKHFLHFLLIFHQHQTRLINIIIAATMFIKISKYIIFFKSLLLYNIKNTIIKKEWNKNSKNNNYISFLYLYIYIYKFICSIYFCGQRF